MTIRVHIESVVVDASLVRHGGVDALRDGLEQRLSELLGSDPAYRDVARRVGADLSLSFTMSAGDGAGAIGTHAAESLHSALGGATAHA